jgi:hypothetical protein
MSIHADHAREQLEVARSMAAQLEEERRALVKTLDPARRVREQGDWVGKIYQAEDAIAESEHGTSGVTGVQISTSPLCWSHAPRSSSIHRRRNTPFH